MTVTSTSSHFPTIPLHLRSAFCYSEGTSYNQSSFIKRSQPTMTDMVSTWSRTPHDGSQATHLEPDRHHLRFQYPSTKTASRVENLWRTMICRSTEKKPLSRYNPGFRNKALLKTERGVGAALKNSKTSKLVKYFSDSQHPCD